MQIEIVKRLDCTINELKNKIQTTADFDDEHREEINKTIEFGKKCHQNQFRDTGDLYFIHSVRVAYRCLDFCSDQVLVSAALLHDVIEDTSTTLEKIKGNFGEDVARLVKALTKFKKEERSLSVERIFRLAQTELRVLLIKIIDRLDNLEDLHLLARKRQRENATESLVYATVAEGIGLEEIATTFRNRAFEINYPLRFKIVQAEIDKLSKLNKPLYDKVSSLLWSTLGAENCREITYTLKTPYDFLLPRYKIFNILKHYTITMDGVLDCYHALGILHSSLKVVPLRFHDYIANPLISGTSGLSTTLICDGLTVNVWITTTKLHLKNKLGIFELIKNKIYQSTTHKAFIKDFTELFAGKNLDLDTIFNYRKNKLAQTYLNNHAEVERLQFSTPKGKIIEMLPGSTVLDFAFAIHSEIGKTCVGAIINETYQVPSTYILQEGNIVNILTDSKARPSDNSLNKVIMPHSRKEIMLYLKKHQKSDT